MGVDGARVNGQRILYNSNNRRNGCKGQNNTEQQQDNILRLGKVRPDPVFVNCCILILFQLCPLLSCNRKRCRRWSANRSTNHLQHLRFSQSVMKPLCLLQETDGFTPYWALSAYLLSISIQLPTVKETEAQYSGSSRTSSPSVVHQS